MSESVGYAYLNVIPRLSKSGMLASEAATAGASMGTAMSGKMSAAVSAGTVALGGIIANVATMGAQAIGSFFSDSIATGMEFDKTMSQVAATMGVSVDEVQELSEFAQEMGATTAFSATQSAEALNYMALAGYDAETAMGMLPTVLDLAAAGSIDLASASDMVTDAQSALGLSLEETSVMVDQMAKASSQSNTSVEQLGSAMLTVGGTAKIVKGGTQEIATALGILADNGIKGSEGGTALRNVILSLTAPTDKAAAAMNSLGLNVFDAEGNMRPLNEVMDDLSGLLGQMTEQDRAEWISTVFNKRDLKSVEALLANTGVNVSDLSAKLEESGVNWEKYAGTATAYGDELSGSAEDMASRVNAAFVDMRGYGLDYEGMIDQLQKRFNLTEEDAVIALKAIQEGTEESTNRWNELSEAIGDSEGAAKRMAETQLDNLAGDVTLFQSALEGVQIAVFHKVEPALRAVVQFASTAASGITEFLNGDAVMGFLDGAASAVSSFLDGLAPVGEALGVLGEAVWGLITAIAEPFAEAFGLAGENTGALGDSLASVLVPIIEGAAAIIRDVVTPIVQAAATYLVENVLPVIGNVADFIINGVVPALGELFTWIGENIIPIVTDMVSSFAEQALPAIMDFAGFIISDVVPALMDLFRWIGDNVVPVVQDLFSWLGDNILPVFSDVAGFITGTLVPAVSDLFSWLNDNVVPVFQDLLQVVKDVLSFLGDVAQAASDAAAEVISAGNSAQDGWYYAQQGVGATVRYFAEGGIVTRPTLGVIGEAGTPEAVIPLDRLDSYMARIADASGGQPGQVVITGNEFNVRSDADIDRIGRTLVEQWSRMQRSSTWAS